MLIQSVCRTNSLRSNAFLPAAFLGLLLPAFIGASAAGYTPESPEVREAVTKAAAFLETAAGNDNRMGGKALIALAMLKAGRPHGDPRIVDAVREIRNTVRPGFDPAMLGDHRLYQVSICCIFLIELDPQAYANEINILLRTLQTNQKPWGAWGYHTGHQHGKTSDTSMTQYGVLAVWEASKANFDVPQDTKDRPLVWLLKTQDPSGGWGYQGRVSPNFSPIPQEEQTPSLTVAGLSSVYACADLLGLADPLVRRLPALQRVDGSGDGASRLAPAQITEVMNRGEHWMERNYTIHPKLWTFYYLYGLERCSSFRDLIEGKVGDNREASPKWYNDGVEFLLRSQGKDGGWEQDHQGVAGRNTSTAFAILFLVRSMQKTIEKTLGAGTLIGGRGLPKDTDAVRLRDGKVVSVPEVKDMEAVLSKIAATGGSEEYDKIADSIATMAAEDATPLVDQHAEMFRKLVGNREPEARLAAVTALGKRRNMDDVPVLIYALGDPDPQIVLVARDALRRISCKFDGFGLPDEYDSGTPSKKVGPERRASIARWKEWFLEVRPDAEFPE